MYIILSPSKTQDFSRNFPAGISCAMPSPYRAQTKRLVTYMQTRRVKDLEQSMHVSKNIARLTQKRFAQWTNDFDRRQRDAHGVYNFSPAIYAFTGMVYQGFDLAHYTKQDFIFAHKHLRILSGLYGCISPMTFIRPYRLEMGAKIAPHIDGKTYKNLYDFWQEKLTAEFCASLQKNEKILNLASREYAKALSGERCTQQIVDVTFKTLRDGHARVVAVYAKKARGLFANWVIKNRINEISAVHHFCDDGWQYDRKSSTATHLVFTKQQ